MQFVTAIEKVQVQRKLTDDELKMIDELYSTLLSSNERLKKDCKMIQFTRGLDAVGSILGKHNVASEPGSFSAVDIPQWNDQSGLYETFPLNHRALPRLFTGLWQLSSPSWGYASEAEIFDSFFEYVGRSFTAYDMADHYGDAEVIFVSAHSAQKTEIYC